MKKAWNKLKTHFKGVLRIKSSPHSIAMGFALGTLIAILPTFGLGIFIGLGIILIFKKISKISMMVSFIIWNPVVLFFMYGLSYTIGDFLFIGSPIKTYELEILNKLFVYSRRFLIGNLILAVSLSMVCYFIVFFSTRYYQKTHPLKKIEKIIQEELQRLEIKK